ncbi:UNVERIFIED_CONTAM: hypothetical protein Slati_4581000 [Sesamum latifolium]|uniref:Uncharacterized protein n=1 Tax=Sesamum latifolium TaxID=2727402 RepID=A0AAW2S306_9LAMI
MALLVTLRPDPSPHVRLSPPETQEVGFANTTLGRPLHSTMRTPARAAFWEARSHRAHGPAGLPAVVGILPFPGQRLGWMRDLLHEERVVSTGCFRAAKLTPIRISSSKVPYPYARIIE